MGFNMSKTILAEYDAERNVLILPERPPDVANHEKVEVHIHRRATTKAPERPWMASEGALDEKSGREIAKAVREAFGRDEIEI
jgi:hypothetical protein